MSISAQTATEYTMPLIDAVFAEIEKLKNEIVDEYELLNLKGYLMGEIARLFDGPFSISDAYLALLANDMDVSYYKNMIEAIKSVTSEDIIFLTKKYLLKEKFYIVICGKKE